MKLRQTAAYVFGVIVYLSVTISALRTIADPTEEDNREDQVMALRVLSAGNVIIIGCLTLILALQVCRCQGTVEFIFSTSQTLQGGQEWASRQEEKARAEAEAKEKQDVSAEKKEQ